MSTWISSEIAEKIKNSESELIVKRFWKANFGMMSRGGRLGTGKFIIPTNDLPQEREAWICRIVERQENKIIVEPLKLVGREVSVNVARNAPKYGIGTVCRFDKRQRGTVDGNIYIMSPRQLERAVREMSDFIFCDGEKEEYEEWLSSRL